MDFRKPKRPGRLLLLALAVLCFEVAIRGQTEDQSWRPRGIIDNAASGMGGYQDPPLLPRESQGIINNAASPYTRLHSVPVHAVRMGDGFWSARMRINVEKSIPTMLQELEDHGVMNNFRRISGRMKVERRGPLFTDSDIYKSMEAVAFALQSSEPSPETEKLRATVDSLTDEVLAAQEPSGYLNTYWSEDRASKRFTEMQRSHELYCLGHMLQAGIAYYRATGNRKLLDGGIKFANYMVENFGPNKRPALTGHPELEMALVELYRTTGDRRYLDFAGYLLSGVERERLKLTDAQIKYMFSGTAFTSRTQLEGHAVRAMYACSGATDYYTETGDPAYRRTLETLWQDLVNHKMYITGGVGSRAVGEAFGEPYELPNAQAYTESCAAIGNMMWNWRMLQISGEARFTDVIERALYNGINSGMSLSGTLYCYRNPLESSGERIRNPWYDVTCCPPNLERTFASLPGYVYSTSREGVYVHLYHSSMLDWHLEDGTVLKLSQNTDYPWGNTVKLTVTPARPSEFTVFVRIPGWTRSASVMVNGGPAQGDPKPGQYFGVRRAWNAGDQIVLSFDMTPRTIVANPRLRENAGRVAIERGPLVYCLEQTDQPGLESIFDASLRLSADPSQGFTSEFRPDILGGVLILRHKGTATRKPLSDDPLYRTLEIARPEPGVEVDLTFVPYYAWANRGFTSMEVWVPYTMASAKTEVGQ